MEEDFSTLAFGEALGWARGLAVDVESAGGAEDSLQPKADTRRARRAKDRVFDMGGQFCNEVRRESNGPRKPVWDPGFCSDLGWSGRRGDGGWAWSR